MNFSVGRSVTILSIFAMYALRAGASCGALLDLKISYPWMDSVYEQTPAIKSVIEAGVHSVRTARASGKSEVEQIQEAVKVVRSKISYSKCAAAYPEPTFSLALDLGQGGCQHFAVLTAAILANTEFVVQFVVLKKLQAIGHVWLEVVATLSEPAQKYIVDPSEPNYVVPIGEAFRRYKQNKFNDEGLWYLNSQTEYFSF